MKFEISNHADELFQNGQVRLTIDTDADAAIEILQVAAGILGRRAEEASNELLRKVLGG